MPTATEDEKVMHLVGSPDNPAREPRKRPSTGKGSIGDVAFRDAVILVIVAWIVVLFLMYSLKSHNV
jgi:hypothetical protein